jgi:O-antigen ligase
MGQDIQTHRVTIHRLLLISILVFGLYECLLGCAQLFGLINSNNVAYRVTGTFYNPGPYGCFVAVVMPIAIMQFISKGMQLEFWLSTVYVLVGLMILPITESRTGWIATILTVAYLLIYRYRAFRISLRSLFMVIAIVVALLYLMYMLKPQSALGRIFLWKIGFDAWLAHPIFGIGWSNVPGALGLAQEQYFAAYPSSIFADIAGTPAYAYNEFLQIAIAFGLVGLIAFMIFIGIWILLAYRQSDYAMVGTIMAFIVICISSYPLQFSEFHILIAMLFLPVG